MSDLKWSETINETIQTAYTPKNKELKGKNGIQVLAKGETGSQRILYRISDFFPKYLRKAWKKVRMLKKVYKNLYFNNRNNPEKD